MNRLKKIDVSPVISNCLLEHITHKSLLQLLKIELQ